MSTQRPRASSRLRSTLDRVLIHDIKNMGFRLQLLLSNLEEHYADPDFKGSVRELLDSTIQRLNGIIGRYSAHQDAVLIKVEVDLNAVLRDVAEGTTRRGGRPDSPALNRRPPALALGPVPEIWADPYYLRDALASLVENALEAVGSEGRVVVRSFPDEKTRRPRAVVEIIDNGTGMSPEFVEDRLFQPFQTTKPDGVGLGMATAHEIIRFHRGTIRVLTRPGGGTVVRVTFPGVARRVSAGSVEPNDAPDAPE